MLQNATKMLQIFLCDVCNYETERKYCYKKHLLTRKHRNATKKLQKVASNPDSILSSYIESPKQSFLNDPGHNATKMLQKSCKKLQKKSFNNYKCDTCGKSYKHKTSLYRHVRICTLNNPLPPPQPAQNDQNQDISSLLKIVKSSQDLQTKMMDVFKEMSQTNITNTINNNQQISINVFLNEHCKEAMNLTDFVDNIKVNSQDLNVLTELGHVQGYANIILKALKNLPSIERPIHCSDTKKMEFYVKDHNNWGKDNGEKMEQAIEDISVRNIKKLKEWEHENPDYENNPKTNEQWNNIIKNIIGGYNPTQQQQNKKNIIRQISASIDINEAIKQLKS
jgi:hypothetical protein